MNVIARIIASGNQVRIFTFLAVVLITVVGLLADASTPAHAASTGQVPLVVGLTREDIQSRFGLPDSAREWRPSSGQRGIQWTYDGAGTTFFFSSDICVRAESARSFSGDGGGLREILPASVLHSVPIVYFEFPTHMVHHTQLSFITGLPSGAAATGYCGLQVARDYNQAPHWLYSNPIRETIREMTPEGLYADTLIYDLTRWQQVDLHHYRVKVIQSLKDSREFHDFVTSKGIVYSMDGETYHTLEALNEQLASGSGRVKWCAARLVPFGTRGGRLVDHTWKGSDNSRFILRTRM